MIFSRLVGAWLLVTVWWLVLAAATAHLGLGALSRRLGTWRCVEALLLTLFSSLWFASLGNGQWWLLFALVGAMVAGATAVDRQAPGAPTLLLGITADVVRYVVAGGILAARLR